MCAHSLASAYLSVERSDFVVMLLRQFADLRGVRSPMLDQHLVDFG